jgi:hypothetical protein
MLSRAAGIPARMAVGFLPATPTARSGSCGSATTTRGRSCSSRLWAGCGSSPRPACAVEGCRPTPSRPSRAAVPRPAPPRPARRRPAETPAAGQRRTSPPAGPDARPRRVRTGRGGVGVARAPTWRLGVTAADGATPRQASAQLGKALPHRGQGAALGRVAATLEQARYAPPGGTVGDVEQDARTMWKGALSPRRRLDRIHALLLPEEGRRWGARPSAVAAQSLPRTTSPGSGEGRRRDRPRGAQAARMTSSQSSSPAALVPGVFMDAERRASEVLPDDGSNHSAVAPGPNRVVSRSMVRDVGT